ncbi:MAG TPA: HNH endonuclease [Verrucomicrobiales bacterium]|nr:HNH endonuclease [Verrucomicrobiales bacterium]HRJ07705.1 HNH endonuclease [Prosthecobacter sp.]HRK15281.1 HNH endonuclease [Prosthecobacter sp.]
MSDVLNKTTVLVLNRNWQAVGVKTPAEAFGMMAAGNATALQISGDDFMSPVRWEDWLRLPVRDDDNSIGTVHGPVRVPTVLVLARFDKVPKRRPKFCAKAIWERDGGVCQYTGRKLKPNEGNIDHVVPVSRGGKSTWDNCVLADKKVNSKKGSKLPDEAGLKLLRRPFAPREVPVTHLIRNTYKVRDWEMFLAHPGVHDS